MTGNPEPVSVHCRKQAFAPTTGKRAFRDKAVGEMAIFRQFEVGKPAYRFIRDVPCQGMQSFGLAQLIFTSTCAIASGSETDLAVMIIECSELRIVDGAE
jgi:hypothetical protein